MISIPNDTARLAMKTLAYIRKGDDPEDAWIDVIEVLEGIESAIVACGDVQSL